MQQISKWLELAGVPTKWASAISLSIILLSIGFSAREVYAAGIEYAEQVDAIQKNQKQLQQEVRRLQEVNELLVLHMYRMSRFEEYSVDKIIELIDSPPSVQKVLINAAKNDVQLYEQEYLPHYAMKNDSVMLFIKPVLK